MGNRLVAARDKGTMGEVWLKGAALGIIVVTVKFCISTVSMPTS